MLLMFRSNALLDASSGGTKAFAAEAFPFDRMDLHAERTTTCPGEREYGYGYRSTG